MNMNNKIAFDVHSVQMLVLLVNFYSTHKNFLKQKKKKENCNNTKIENKLYQLMK